MKLLLIGPQASGKGTQAKLLAEKLGVPHISTGDLLRAQTGEIRKEIDSYIVSGNLYPNEKMLKILKERFEREDCNEGYILDGFPRNLKQAEMLDEITKIDKVIEIDISDEEAVRRLGGRVSCENCDEGYNLVTIPPKDPDKCDKCGGGLVIRDDDKEDAIRKRLGIYHGDTEPILARYGLVKINGEQSIEKVQEEIVESLGV
ncbi:MAG: nucleoside monophosphate kinase [Nanoarchaeota archaeon]|nr:nucleoside monophosphate kinase [Nanoarchaeota archaeon]MBU1051533.1 nucleoside monophosphate kinase [Nanoarchaeota archaeon]MBU1988211.1 nucleoside monophosphate kinase [Nanoarchaeota archaeon]